MGLISAALIVKNEAKHIDQCLTALAKVADEIVIADTGSDDTTIDLARQYTENIIEIPWENDFAKARNIAIEHATGDWILVVDADETIVHPVEARKTLIEFAGAYPNHMGTILVKSPVITNMHESISYSHIKRFFPREGFHYIGAIHEQIEPIDRIAQTAPTGVTVDHSGYFHAVDDKNHKALRNIPLLQQAIKNQKNDEYMHYQLGRALFTIERLPAAINAFEETLRLIRFSRNTPPTGLKGPISREILTNVVVSLGYAYINTGQLAKARELLDTHLLMGHSGTEWADFHHFAGYVAFMEGNIAQATQHYKKSMEFGPHHEDVQGSGSYSSAYHLALLAETLHNIKDAESYYELSLQYDPSYQPALERYLDFIIENRLEISIGVQRVLDPDYFHSCCMCRIADHLNNKNTEQAVVLCAIIEILESQNPVLTGDLLPRCQELLAAGYRETSKA